MSLPSGEMAIDGRPPFGTVLPAGRGNASLVVRDAISPRPPARANIASTIAATARPPAAAATVHAMRSGRTVARYAGVALPVATHSNSFARSEAVCQRASGFLARHLVTM